MSTTRVSLDAALLTAKAKVGRWREKFYQEWYAHEILAEQTQAYLASDEATRQALAASDPELHRKIVQNINSLAGRLRGRMPAPMKGESHVPPVPR